MSKVDMEDRSAVGYFLPEDGQLRLRKLHQHIECLSRLAGPSVRDAQGGRDTAALIGCLDLLAEQVRQVLDTVRWPARQEGAYMPAAAGGKPAVGEAAGTSGECAADRGGAARNLASAEDDDYAFGVTLDQVDEANRLLDLLAAQSDLLMAGGGREFASGTLVVIGASIFDSADAVHDIVRQISTRQHITGDGRKVREMHSVYDNVVDIACGRHTRAACAVNGRRGFQ